MSKVDQMLNEKQALQDELTRFQVNAIYSDNAATAGRNTRLAEKTRIAIVDLEEKIERLRIQ